MVFCICTPYPINSEPRGPRHAYSLAKNFPKHTFILFCTATAGELPERKAQVDDLPNLTVISHPIFTKQTGLISVLLDRFAKKLAEWRFRLWGNVSPTLFSPFMRGVPQKLRTINADGYYAHNTEMLAACATIRKPGDLLILDAMEFYSDMGDGQTNLQREAARQLESTELPHYHLLTCSSPEVAKAYEETYSLKNFVSSYNCPPIETTITCRPSEQPLQLYWRNAVLGIGQRGLSDVLDALVELPEEITLHLQGRLANDGGASLRREISLRKLSKRVFILDPHPPGQAVLAASRHTVGLCLERNVNRNHQLTVSNKMFDYLMAGLAVVASDLPGLARVIKSSKGGLLYEAGDVHSLRNALLILHNDRAQLQTLRNAAREFALLEGNREHQLDHFINAVRPHFDPSP